MAGSKPYLGSHVVHDAKRVLPVAQLQEHLQHHVVYVPLQLEALVRKARRKSDMREAVPHRHRHAMSRNNPPALH